MVSSNLYDPPTKGRYIYLSKNKCNNYTGVVKTPFYIKYKIFDSLEDCKDWIDWYSKDVPLVKESSEDASIRYAEVKLNKKLPEQLE